MTMTKKEKLLIVYGLTTLTDKLGIQEKELMTEEQHEKFEKVLEENQKIFSDDIELKTLIIHTFNKFIEDLSSVKEEIKSEGE